MILITGASRGIGEYLFDKLTSSGEIVFGTYNKTQPDECKSKMFSSVQIEDLASVQNWINSIKKKSELVLINCAGINYNCFSHKVQMDEWRKVINVNLIGTFNVIHTILPFMRNEGFGRIINLSSVVAQSGVIGTSAYATSKSGLNGLIKTVAKENASKGIMINNINLGYFDIGMINEVPEAHRNLIKKEIPTGKLGDPVNILYAVQFLIKTDYITGSSIDINGGLI